MDVSSKQKKKISNYIESDRYKKLTKYIDKEGIPVNAIINRKGEKMVHLCCRKGATSCLEALIEKGGRVNLVDKQGNLPLHLALRHTLTRYSAALEADLVHTLLTYSSGWLDQKNMAGVSCRALLSELQKLKDEPDGNVLISSDDNSSSDGDSEKVKEASEKEWLDKLQYECEAEFDLNLGKYESAEYTYCDDSRESYDAWADRIYAAYFGRQGSRHVSAYKKKADRPEEGQDRSGAKKSLKPPPSAKKSGGSQSVEKLRKAQQHARIRNMYAKLFHTDEAITAGDIPFGNLTPAEVMDIMLADCLDRGRDEVKKCIREELRRWHPDKFRQKMGSRILASDTEAVMDKVKTIAQALTSYAK